MKIRSFLTNPLILAPVMFFALFVAWFSASLLSFGYPFRKLFPETCSYLPDEDLGPTLVVFLFALGSATACFVTMLRRYEWLRRFTLRFLVAMIAFCFGVLVTA